VLYNAVMWAAPDAIQHTDIVNAKVPLEPIRKKS
jgi:hypothetical protein